MSVGAIQSTYMDTVLNHSLQTQGQVLLDLISVVKTAFETSARPLKPISASPQKIDVYA